MTETINLTLNTDLDTFTAWMNSPDAILGYRLATRVRIDRPRDDWGIGELERNPKQGDGYPTHRQAIVYLGNEETWQRETGRIYYHLLPQDQTLSVRIRWEPDLSAPVYALLQKIAECWPETAPDVTMWTLEPPGIAGRRAHDWQRWWCTPPVQRVRAWAFEAWQLQFALSLTWWESLSPERQDAQIAGFFNRCIPEPIASWSPERRRAWFVHSSPLSPTGQPTWDSLPTDKRNWAEVGLMVWDKLKRHISKALKRGHITLSQATKAAQTLADLEAKNLTPLGAKRVLEAPLIPPKPYKLFALYIPEAATASVKAWLERMADKHIGRFFPGRGVEKRVTVPQAYTNGPVCTYQIQWGEIGYDPDYITFELNQTGKAVKLEGKGTESTYDYIRFLVETAKADYRDAEERTPLDGKAAPSLSLTRDENDTEEIGMQHPDLPPENYDILIEHALRDLEHEGFTFTYDASRYEVRYKIAYRGEDLLEITIGYPALPGSLPFYRERSLIIERLHNERPQIEWTPEERALVDKAGRVIRAVHNDFDMYAQAQAMIAAKQKHAEAQGNIPQGQEEEKEHTTSHAITKPEEPSGDAGYDAWFAWYHSYTDKLGYKMTLRELASKIGLSYGYVRSLHSVYMSEHGEYNND